MDADCKLFVSFSGRAKADKDFAVRLLARFKEAGLQPWLYEQRGSEIPAGEHIDDACRKQIRKSDMFVCIISDSSLGSPSTLMEVQFAAGALEPDEICQVVTTSVPAETWPAPYQALAAYKRIDARLMASQDIEEVVLSLCAGLGVAYSPPSDGAPRLPLVRRLTRELESAKVARPHYESGDYAAMRSHAIHASEAYCDGRLHHAFSFISKLNFSLEELYPDHAFYYPRLIMGVLYLQLANDKPYYLNEARDIFKQLHTDTRLDGRRDENLYAAMAYEALLSGRADQALALYFQAHELVALRGEVDADIIHNIVVAYLGMDGWGRHAEIMTLLDRVAHQSVTSDPLFHQRMQALRAAMLARGGDVEGAADCLTAMQHEEANCIDILCSVAQEMSCSPRLRDGSVGPHFVLSLYAVVLSRATPEQSAGALLSLAGFHYSLGAYREALAALQRIGLNHPGRLKIDVEMALVLAKLDHLAEAKNLLANAAASSVPLGKSEADTCEALYFRGFAAYLTGAAEQARRDFQDSRYDERLAYQTVAANHAGLDALREPESPDHWRQWVGAAVWGSQRNLRPH